MIIISMTMLVNMPVFLTNISGILNNPSLMFTIGAFVTIFGILLVVSHNIWQWNWRLIITLIAWVILLKGVSIFLFPQFMDRISMRFIQDIHFAYAIAAFEMIMGLLLIYFGFRR
jgi:hypothetical protein